MYIYIIIYIYIFPRSLVCKFAEKLPNPDPQRRGNYMSSSPIIMGFSGGKLGCQALGGVMTPDWRIIPASK